MAPRPDLFDEVLVVLADGELDPTTVPAFVRELAAARHGAGRGGSSSSWTCPA
ncbi:hypothetical protein [Streptomyces sp. SAS_260]|uniref:hypothetical protein n=1 Tax=Streptomyces sp. SAS_260 TaxID=3412751 RepID=UPI00403CF038